VTPTQSPVETTNTMRKTLTVKEFHCQMGHIAPEAARKLVKDGIVEYASCIEGAGRNVRLVDRGVTSGVASSEASVWFSVPFPSYKRMEHKQGTHAHRCR